MKPEPLDRVTSARLGRQARHDTGPERALRKALWAAGYRYRLHVPITETRRTIDIAFRGLKIAVFVDGCFWHGCPRHSTIPKNNSTWWKSKIETNRLRDENTNRLLRKRGWVVIRVWEHEKPAIAARKIARAIDRRTTLT